MASASVRVFALAVSPSDVCRKEVVYVTVREVAAQTLR